MHLSLHMSKNIWNNINYSESILHFFSDKTTCFRYAIVHFLITKVTFLITAPLERIKITFHHHICQANSDTGLFPTSTKVFILGDVLLECMELGPFNDVGPWVRLWHATAE